jgi:c-di-GMP-related signal transduction protein
MRTFGPRGIVLLAEKVETYEEFEWARRLGYTYFQGYFLARPTVIRSKQVAASKISCLRLLGEVQASEFGFKRRTEIRSIERALTIMGTNDVRRWIALVTLSTLATDKPGDWRRSRRFARDSASSW